MVFSSDGVYVEEEEEEELNCTGGGVGGVEQKRKRRDRESFMHSFCCVRNMTDAREFW